MVEVSAIVEVRRSYRVSVIAVTKEVGFDMLDRMSTIDIHLDGKLLNAEKGDLESISVEPVDDEPADESPIVA